MSAAYGEMVSILRTSALNQVHRFYCRISCVRESLRRKLTDENTDKHISHFKKGKRIKVEKVTKIGNKRKADNFYQAKVIRSRMHEIPDVRMEHIIEKAHCWGAFKRIIVWKLYLKSKKSSFVAAASIG